MVSCLFMLPAFILVVVLLIVPMLQNIYCFFEWDGLGKPVLVGIRNFAALFQDSVLS